MSKGEPIPFQQGEPNYWLEILLAGSQEIWRQARTVIACLELLERESGDITFELLAIHHNARIGRGVYQRSGEVNYVFQTVEEETALVGLFEPAVKTYLEERTVRLKAQEVHPCAFPRCHEKATGNDLAREITIIDDRGEPAKLAFYGCETHFNDVANASIELRLMHRTASSGWLVFTPTCVDPVPREPTRLYLPQPTPIPAFEKPAQRRRREEREARIAAWLQEAYATGVSRSRGAEEDPHQRYRRACSILATEFLPEAKKTSLIRANREEDGQLQTRWVQHYLEGDLGIAFGALETVPEVCDILYPRLGRVQR
jgi:hypothetical protein